MRQMKLTLTLANVAAAGLAVLIPLGAPAQAATSPVKILHCFVTEPKAFSKNASGTQIDYINVGSQAAKSVTFAVGYRNAASHFLRKVTDDGRFSPGDTIQHHFQLYNDVTYAGKQTTSCSAIKVVWANGSVWTP